MDIATPVPMSSHVFPAKRRLDQRGVSAVLKNGKRRSCNDFDLRILRNPDDIVVRKARIAISVPKRQLKSAVARNRVKRLVRETIRQHELFAAPLDLLLTYKSRSDARQSHDRAALRAELASLFAGAFSTSQDVRKNR